MHKPSDWTMHQNMACMTEVNKKLKQFPPFEENQELAEEELIDIFEFAVPSCW